MKAEYDIVVVGAGSAGAALAARLTEDPSRSVALVEAGPDYRSADTDPLIRDFDPMPLTVALGRRATLSTGAIAGASMDPYRYPQLFATRTTAQAPLPYLRGRGVGGSSAINALFAIRPTVADLDEWARDGCAGWSFDEVLPLLNRLEGDQNFGAAEYHGQIGPIPVSRVPLDEFTPFDLAFRDAALAAGHRWEPDHNAPNATGVSPWAYNARGKERITTNDGYLEPARDRDNLDILGDTVVDRVILERGRARGVAGIRLGEAVEFRAAEVVLAAGAIHTPAILLRSGIGPAPDLVHLGVTVAADLPVGHGLQDHAAVFLVLRYEDAVPGIAPGRQTRCALRFDLGIANDSNDGCIAAATSPQLGNVALIAGWVNRVKSVGRVRLSSLDPRIDPVVELNLLSDPEDMEKLIRVVDEFRELAAHPALRQGTTDVSLSEPTTLTPLLGINDKLPRAELEQLLQANVYDTLHASGSCRMGRSDDPSAVVDSQCRVLGIDGLRVADTSVLRWVPRANTAPVRRPRRREARSRYARAAPSVNVGIGAATRPSQSAGGDRPPAGVRRSSPSPGRPHEARHARGPGGPARGRRSPGAREMAKRIVPSGSKTGAAIDATSASDRHPLGRWNVVVTGKGGEGATDLLAALRGVQVRVGEDGVRSRSRWVRSTTA